MNHIKWQLFSLRTLCFLIDATLIYVSVSLICLLVFGISTKASDLYAQLVFIGYNLLCSDMFKGQTIGKKIGRLVTVYQDGVKAPLIKKGMREATKLLYFLPYVGPIFGLISLTLLKIKGRALHDYFGESEVMLECSVLKGELK